jgi:glycosyltransferase involved in cell wall biosynthesis
MKILYLTNSIPKPSNTMEGIFNLRRIRELLKKGIEVEVCYINNILKRDFSIKFDKDYNLKDLGFDIDLKIKVFNNLKLPNIESLNFIFYRIARYYYKNNFDLIHTHFIDWGYIGYILNKKYKIPYIITAHGSDIHTRPFENKRYRKKALLALKNSCYNIFVSNFLKSKAKEFGYINKKDFIIPNGIENNFLNKEVKTKLKTVGFVGNLVEVKRADLLPDIFNEVIKNKENVDFLIVGDGKLRYLIEDKITKYNLKKYIKLVGRVHPNEVKNYMDKMYIMILPSKNEGWPCVVLEAQAAGTLVLGSNNGGIPEAVGNKEFIVEDDENFIENMSKKIIYYIENGYDSKALVDRAKKFTWDKIVEKEISVYKKILEEQNEKN